MQRKLFTLQRRTCRCSSRAQLRTLLNRLQNSGEQEDKAINHALNDVHFTDFEAMHAEPPMNGQESELINGNGNEIWQSEGQITDTQGASRDAFKSEQNGLRQFFYGPKYLQTRCDSSIKA